MYSSLLLFAQIDNYIITTSCPDITGNIINVFKFKTIGK